MAYVIAELIYGIPLLEEIELPLPAENDLCFPYYERSKVLEDALENMEEKGFITSYSGNSQTQPGAFGVCLDTFESPDLFSELNINISPEIKEKFDKLWSNLPAILQQEIKVYGIPLSWDYYALTNPEEYQKYLLIKKSFKKSPGILQYKSKQSGSYSFAFGFEINSFSAYAHHGSISSQMIEVSPQQKENFQTLLSMIPLEVQNIVQQFGQPRLFLVWSDISKEN